MNNTEKTSEELVALEKIRVVLKDSFKFPLNLTAEYKIIYDALTHCTVDTLATLYQTTYITGDPNLVTQTYLCPKCNHDVSNDTNFCSNCGKKIKK